MEKEIELILCLTAYGSTVNEAMESEVPETLGYFHIPGQVPTGWTPIGKMKGTLILDAKDEVVRAATQILQEGLRQARVRMEGLERETKEKLANLQALTWEGEA